MPLRTAAKPGEGRAAKPQPSLASLVSSAVLRFARLAVVSRHLKEEKMEKKILANLQAFKIRILKAYVWGKVEVLVAVGRRKSSFTCGSGLSVQATGFPSAGGTGRSQVPEQVFFWRGGALFKLLNCKMSLSHF